MLQPLPTHPKRQRFRYMCGAPAEHASLDPARRAVEPRCDECVTRLAALLAADPHLDHLVEGPPLTDPKWHPLIVEQHIPRPQLERIVAAWERTAARVAS